MRRYISEFRCNSGNCDTWVSSTVVVAESKEEYENLKRQLATPFGEWDNGDLTQQQDCPNCSSGKINVIRVKKEFRDKI